MDFASLQILSVWFIRLHDSVLLLQYQLSSIYFSKFEIFSFEVFSAYLRNESVLKAKTSLLSLYGGD
jgi:hypothetical protein